MPWASIDTGGYGFHLAQFKDISHIAVEYNPEWGIEISKSHDPEATKAVRVFTDITKQIGDTATGFLWFVDYGLRRKHGERTGLQEMKRKTFYATDRRYVEVDTGSKVSNEWEHLYESEDGTWASSAEFVHCVNIYSDVDYTFSGELELDCMPCRVGLLACEFT